MLSILIPIYNQDATTLVSDLISQCENEGIDFLISVYDDKSTRKWKAINAPLHHTFKVNYIELSENLGRAKIRNWLASAAPYDNLLFLDGDSGIVKDDFIRTYIGAIHNGYDVIYGGRAYKKKQPRSTKRRLHWKYGKTREALPASVRQRQPALNFQSNNFLIKATIFDKIKFDQNIEGYGYEDLLFSKSLVERGFNISHIHNPIEHLGLEKTADFLTKNEQAVINLIKLQKQGLLQHTRLTKSYDKLKKYGLHRFIPFIYNRFKSKIETKLHAKDPDVRAFQITKLYWYHIHSMKS